MGNGHADVIQEWRAGADISEHLDDHSGRSWDIAASQVVDALWAWAAGTTRGSWIEVPRLEIHGGRRARLTGRCEGHPFTVDAVVAGDSLADSDVVVPAVGASIELRPYHRHGDLTILQPTLLTLATSKDWAALANDAAGRRPLGSCLLGLAAMHLFDPANRTPDCGQHSRLYRSWPVTAEVRRHARQLERERRRDLAAIATATTNHEWV